MDKAAKTLYRAIAVLLCAAALGASVEIDTAIPAVDAQGLAEEWKQDQDYTLVEIAPRNLA